MLRQLSAYVGEENFTAGLRAYLARHSYGNVRLADILAAVTGASGKDLAAWSETWLKTAEPAELLCSAEPGSDYQLSWFELLSWTAANEDELQLLTVLLDGTRTVPGLVLAAEPRLTALRHLAAVGEADDARIDAELAMDPSDAGRRNAAACRAAIPDPGHKEAAWRLLVNETTGPETVTAVADGLMQPEHADLLIPYASRFLAAEGSDRGLSRIVRDHRDTAERVLRARALDLSPGRG